MRYQFIVFAFVSAIIFNFFIVFLLLQRGGDQPPNLHPPKSVFFLYSHYLSAEKYVDFVRRNQILITLDFVNISTVFIIIITCMCNNTNCFSTATNFEIKDPDRPVGEVIIKMTLVQVCFRKRDVNIFESTSSKTTSCLPLDDVNHQSLTGFNFRTLATRPLRKPVANFSFCWDHSSLFLCSFQNQSMTVISGRSGTQRTQNSKHHEVCQ